MPLQGSIANMRIRKIALCCEPFDALHRLIRDSRPTTAPPTQMRDWMAGGLLSRQMMYAPPLAAISQSLPGAVPVSTTIRDMKCARSRAGSEINGHINDFSYPQDRRAQQGTEDDTDEQTEEYELVESVRPRPNLV